MCNNHDIDPLTTLNPSHSPLTPPTHHLSCSRYLCGLVFWFSRVVPPQAPGGLQGGCVGEDDGGAALLPQPQEPQVQAGLTEGQTQALAGGDPREEGHEMANAGVIWTAGWMGED